MARKNFIAGNWKMNLNKTEATVLAAGLDEKLGQLDQVDIGVCPPFIYLSEVLSTLANSDIVVGAQDVYFESNGAFTGEISVEMLNDIGCPLVLVGHSERRHVLGENDEVINQKLLASLTGQLNAILCIGELLDERESEQTKAVLERQLKKGLAQVKKAQMAQVTIAYEPVWAIGTGKTATTAQAQEAHAFCRQVLGKIFDDGLAQTIRILYGGSVKPANAAELMSNPDVDGVLVGGASLKLEDFIGIIEAGMTTNSL
jgi:triosephosphate isomerase